MTTYPAGAELNANVNLADINTGRETQARFVTDEPTINRYKEALENGADLPPVVLFFDGTTYWIGDGFHRIAANRRLNHEHTAAQVVPGGRREALLHAVGANDEHGLLRSNVDKRMAVEALLRDSEWSQWSDRRIADQCRVSPPYMAKIRKAIEASKPASTSVNGLQMDCAPAPRRRKARRNGKVIDVDTANIGKKPKDRPPAVEPELAPELQAGETVPWTQKQLFADRDARARGPRGPNRVGSGADTALISR